MKKLASLSLDQLTSVFSENETLKEKLWERVSENEMYFIGEKLDILRDGLSDWNIGFYNNNSLNMGNHVDFINSAKELLRCYGMSQRCEKLLKQCEKLLSTESNLTCYHAEKLCDWMLEDEFQCCIDCIENAFYLCNEDFTFYVDSEVRDVDNFDDYYIKNDGSIIEVTQIGSIA